VAPQGSLLKKRTLGRIEPPAEGFFFEPDAGEQAAAEEAALMALTMRPTGLARRLRRAVVIPDRCLHQFAGSLLRDERRSGAAAKSPGLTLSPDDPLAKPRQKAPGGKK
jgi:hypothetical protein